MNTTKEPNKGSFFLYTMKNIFWFFILLMLSFSCKEKNRSAEKTLTTVSVADSSMSLRYAIGFDVAYYDGYKRVILYNPWDKGSELIRYYLLQKKGVKVPKDGVVLSIPLTSMASGSCTHNTFLQQLGLLHLVTGVCDTKRIYNEEMRRAVESGRIIDLGDPFNINLERCLLLKPDVLMINSFNKQDEHVNRISDAGIPVLYNNEWMETNLLGRAEWIRFIACFFDKEAIADSLFREIEVKYNRLKKLAATTTFKPTVLSGDDFRGTWYLPGGKSFTTQLFVDAGADYVYAKDTSVGSKPFTFEQVLHDFHQASVWVGVTNASSLQDLKKIDERYTLFDAFKKGNVWSYNLRTTPQGGNDFWETGVARPDYLLSDFIQVFHPELKIPEDFHFLKKVN